MGRELLIHREKGEKEQCQEVATMVQISPMVTLVSIAETLGFTDILKVDVLNHKQTLVSTVVTLVFMVETLDSTAILKVAAQNPNQTLVMVSTTEILAAVSMEEMM